MVIIYKTSAIAIGALISVMVTVNGILSGFAGVWFSVLVIHAVGLAAVLIVILAVKRKKVAGKIPLYLFSAGAIGVLVTYFNNVCIPELGTTFTLALCLAGQSLLAVLIDHFGLLGMKRVRFNKKKIIGFLLVAVGLVAMTLF